LHAGGVRVPDSTAVHELSEDAAAIGMYCRGDLLPGIGLGGVDQTRRARICLTLNVGLNTIGDEEPRRGALSEVCSHRRGGATIDGASEPTHRSHSKTIGKAKPGKVVRIEQ
jgi:hypothetical protein